MRKLLLAAAAVLACAIVVPLGFVSSHREAPGIALDPSADNTDTYAWTAKDAPGALTVAADWIPGEVPGERPELPLVRRPRPLLHPCRQHGRRPARRQLPVQLQDEGSEQELVPVRAPGRERVRRPEAERRSSATRSCARRHRYHHGQDRVSEKTLARGLPVAPPNIGPKTFPSYDNFVTGAIRSLHDGTKLFVGQRDDPFFVDLGATFDGHQRPQAHRQPGRGQGRPERIQRPLGRHADARSGWSRANRQGRRRARRGERGRGRVVHDRAASSAGERRPCEATAAGCRSPGSATRW